MAVRVFGTPITEGNRIQRALAARNNQNADGKFDQVVVFGNQQSQKAKLAATSSTTFGQFYNATGETITYVTAYDWEGSITGQYPTEIKNGQWAVFVHVGTRQPDRQGSVAAVVYNIGNCYDSMISWNNPWKNSDESNTNTAYCEMNDPGYFKSCNWSTIHDKLMASSTESDASLHGYSTSTTIDKGGNTPSVTVVLHLSI